MTWSMSTGIGAGTTHSTLRVFRQPSQKVSRHNDGVRSDTAGRVRASVLRKDAHSGEARERTPGSHTLPYRATGGCQPGKQKDRLYAFSRRLTKLLRHQAVQRGLEVSPDGFVAVHDILRLPENSGPDGITEDDVVTVVQSDQKQRFSLRWRIPGGTGPNDDYEEVQLFSRGSNVTSLMETGANRGKNTRSQMPRCDSANPGNGDVSAKVPYRLEGGFAPTPVSTSDHSSCCSKLRPPSSQGCVLCIRANQGHSMPCIVSEKLLLPVLSVSDLPVRCRQSLAEGHDPEDEAVVNVVHGTYKSRWDKIKTEGLSRMSRNHIHFAGEAVQGEGGVVSGMRGTADLLIYLDVEKALKEGVKLFVSSNEVVLSPGNEHGIIETRFFAKVVDRRTGRVLFRNKA